jgi:hypothetical protein
MVPTKEETSSSETIGEKVLLSLRIDGMDGGSGCDKRMEEEEEEEDKGDEVD